MDTQVTPPEYLPSEAVAWAQENQDLLEFLVEELLETGSWPELSATTRKLAREGKPIALERVLAEMPRPLGFLDHGQDRRIVLLLYGLRMTHAGHKLLSGFIAALRVARDRYAAEGDEEPVLRRADIVQGGVDSNPYVDALGEILIREAPFLGGGLGLASEKWTREVTANIVPYWKAEDIESYLRMRAEELRLFPQFGWGAVARPSDGEVPWASSSSPAESSEADTVSASHFLHDAFISHASEDKDAVARPLAEALSKRGWTTWLDELELTVGDSLTRRIDDALVRSRFGVVVLSRAFFSKEWPQRELAGLAAREIDTGAKVILPVWHDVDHHFIVQHSPVLADRLGALTSTGIDTVAAEISLALGQASADSPGQLTESGAKNVSADPEEGPLLLQIPTTDEEQENLIRDQSDWWEYQLYAGVLMQGRIGLEGKWHNHQLRLPAGPWREPSEPVLDFLSRETGSMRRQMEILDRLFEPELLEQAFGASGVAGESTWIVHIGRGVTQTYESMLDWAAELRRTSVASEYEELLELTARMVDGPVGQIREFIQLVADQIARIPVLIQEAEAKGATTESPMALNLVLHVKLDADNQKKLHAALGRLR